MLHKDERRHEPQDEDLKGRLTTRRSAIDGAAWHEKSKMMVTQCATILLICGRIWRVTRSKGGWSTIVVSS